jgi:hypothetical protein
MSLSVMFTIVAIVVEVAAVEIGTMFSFETGVIVLIISVVTIVAMPFWIRIISVARVIPVGDSYMNLGACRLYHQRGGNDHGEKKHFRFHNLIFS